MFNLIIRLFRALLYPKTQGSWEKPIYEQYKPTSKLNIGVGELQLLLRMEYPEAQVYLSDATYTLPSKQDIEWFLAQDRSNKFDYIYNDFDCDDFSYRLMGQFSVPNWSHLTFGVVWTDKHALNCFVDEDKKFWFVEPQTDEILESLEEWMGSKVRMVVL